MSKTYYAVDKVGALWVLKRVEYRPERTVFVLGKYKHRWQAIVHQKKLITNDKSLDRVEEDAKSYMGVDYSLEYSDDVDYN